MTALAPVPGGCTQHKWSYVNGFGVLDSEPSIVNECTTRFCRDCGIRQEAMIVWRKEHWFPRPEEPSGFHWRDGTFFKRQADGSVSIYSEEHWIDWTIPPNEWASIVASVSAGGETSERWEAAKQFHSGTPSPPVPGGA